MNTKASPMPRATKRHNNETKSAKKPASTKYATPPWSFATFDTTLAAVFIGLIGFGVVMVYSASNVFAERTFGDGYHFLIYQSVYALVGLVVMFVAARMPLSLFRTMTYPVLIASFVLMLLVIAGAGRSVGGATRWIAVGPINVQPAELAKLAIVLWLANSLAKKTEKIRSFSIGFLPHVLIAGLLMLLAMAQPDFGSSVMIGVIVFVMLFVAGAKLGYLIASAATMLPIAWFAVSSSPYRMRRITAFLEPFEHRRGAGYQIVESLKSFESGGWFGVGLGDSRQKLLFLPEAHTDFISAIVGEELGFIGIACLCAAFVFVGYRGARIAWRAKDEYSALLVSGLTLFIGVQAFTNLLVAVGRLPTKGLALPFISYGGSALLVNAAAAGIILAVSRHVAWASSTASASEEKAT